MKNPTPQDSVQELIELWKDGSLSIDDGVITQPDAETIVITYKGTDGVLTTTYSLAETLTSRTDKARPQQFNILKHD